MLRDAVLVCRKDLLVEWRSRVTTRFVGPFVLSVVMLFAFAFDADTTMLRAGAGGLFWVTVLFASNTIAQRNAVIDRSDGVHEALRMSSLSPAGVFAGKTASVFVQLSALEVVLAVAMILMYDVRLGGIGLLAASIPLATISVSAIGALYGSLSAGMDGREALLPLLSLPALAPVLLAATKCFAVALGTGVGPGWRWVAMLGMLMAIHVVAGMATAVALLEES
ncbi:MAG: heme exporter protein CcmB [Microthrixaceae bacterium]|nr:heme exporter protein CcmB [Microthrixaceae bacterium]HPB45443.1 heme exporter protein CcmB [Microthrixaceae bacterium]